MQNLLPRFASSPLRVVVEQGLRRTHSNSAQWCKRQIQQRSFEIVSQKGFPSNHSSKSGRRTMSLSTNLMEQQGARHNGFSMFDSNGITRPSDANGVKKANESIIEEDSDRSGLDESCSSNHHFEGCEKTLEICFRPKHSEPLANDTQAFSSAEQGLRRLSRQDLDLICHHSQCLILSSISNEHLDAYVLSESSLFIYPHMAVIKTCGTTTLLRSIAILIELGSNLGLEIDWVGYSRKNYIEPQRQPFPHKTFDQEVQYLLSHQHLDQNLQGKGYSLGPMDSDQWFVFVGDRMKRTKSTLCSGSKAVVNIMMFGIDREVAERFYYDSYESQREDETEEDYHCRIGKFMTTSTRIDTLCPDAKMDYKSFSPCGYSMNSIRSTSYSTVHVTPEDGFSYASFETNEAVESYQELLKKVVNVFKPNNFVMTLMADRQGLNNLKSNPLACPASDAVVDVSFNSDDSNKMNYTREEIASVNGKEDSCCMMGNWHLNKE